MWTLSSENGGMLYNVQQLAVWLVLAFISHRPSCGFWYLMVLIRMKRNSTFIWNTYTFNNKSRDLVEVYFRRRPVAPFSKLSVTFQDQNPIFRSKYNVIRAAPSQQTEKESFCVVFLSSTKREIRHYHVVVVQRRLKNVQKSVMHVQSCCFANLNLLLFFRSRRRLRRRCLSTLIPTAFRDSVNVRYFEKRAPCSTDGCNL